MFAATGQHVLMARCRFDDNFTDITKGRIGVGQDDEEMVDEEVDEGEYEAEGSDEEEDETQRYAGTAFPLKVTDIITSYSP